MTVLPPNRPTFHAVVDGKVLAEHVSAVDVRELLRKQQEKERERQILLDMAYRNCEEQVTMPKTETIRIATMSEDERTIINVLSREERKEALLKAGQAKIQNVNNRLLFRKDGE